MKKYIGYAAIILPVLGATYGGLMIASDLEIKLNQAHQMASDAHQRISDIQAGAEMTDSNLKMMLEEMNEKINFKDEEAQREIIQMSKVLSVLEATAQTLEKNSYSTVTMQQLQGVQDQLYSLKDSLNEIKNKPGPIDMTPMFYELQNRMQDMQRIIDEHNHGNWN